jgi:hypothetical protein
MDQQLTFTEAEVKSIADFVNLAFKKIKDLDSKEAFEFTKLYTNMAKHIKKCEDHIMELKQVIDNRTEEQKADSR